MKDKKKHTNLVKTVVKICKHSLYTQIIIKKITFFSRYKKEKMLSLLIKSMFNKPSSYSTPLSSWMDIQSRSTFFDLENECKLNELNQIK